MSSLFLVGEEGAVLCRVVHGEVILEGCDWVDRISLRRKTEIFATWRGFSAWYVNDPDTPPFSVQVLPDVAR